MVHNGGMCQCQISAVFASAHLVQLAHQQGLFDQLTNQPDLQTRPLRIASLGGGPGVLGCGGSFFVFFLTPNRF